MNPLSPPGVLITYLRAFLGTRVAALRESEDLGASAVELAVITAVLVGLAVAILAVVIAFAKKQGNTITNTVVPTPGAGN